MKPVPKTVVTRSSRLTSMGLKKQVEGYCVYWQKTLRLQDWDITVVVPDYAPSYFGESTVDRTCNRARIAIRNPILTPPEAGLQDADPEVTTVHELLHIKLPRISGGERAIEVAIEHTARALVALRRGQV